MYLSSLFLLYDKLALTDAFQSFVLNTFADKESSIPALASVDVLKACVPKPVVDNTLMSETAS